MTSSPLSATTTLRDYYNNPVNGKQVSIFAPGTHASVLPATAPTTSAYPETANDGTVNYNVSDSCAETVDLKSVDVDDNEPIANPSQVAVTFTPGPAYYPDQAQTPAPCGPPPVTSQIAVTVDGNTSSPGTVAQAPADGTTPAIVNVTLGDQFGNADSCQPVVLTAISKTSHAVITKQVPTNPCSGSQYNQPGYTGTDGVATFDVSDAALEQVVFGVTDTSPISVWPTNAMTNPDDVAQIHFEPVDASQSSVTITPATAPADGQPAATVTVSLEDIAGQPEQAKSVTLAACTHPISSSCTTDATATVAPISKPSTTDAHGQETFSVGDKSAETVDFQASVPSDGVTVNQVASEVFTEGGVSLSANPASVVADGTGSATLTFSLKDIHNSGVASVPVSLAAGPAGATISTPSATTDATGTAQFMVSDTHPGPVTFTATYTFDTAATGLACLGSLSGTTCTATVATTVDFISQPSTFTVVASPAANVIADGVSSSQVTVTALDAGNHAIAGLPIVLNAAGSNNGAPAVTPPSAVTNGSGQAVFTVADSTAETVTVTPRYQEIGSASATSYAGSNCTTSSCNATIIFVPTEAQQSTMTATPTPPATVPADGYSSFTVTVTLLSGSAAPLAGHSVQLQTGSLTAIITPPSNDFGGLTDSSGKVSFAVTDTQPETVVLHARDLTNGTILDQTVGITFGQTESQASSVVASPSSLPAGGPPGLPNQRTVTVQLVIPASTPTCSSTLSGHMVKLTTPSGTALLSPPVTTGSSGQAVFTVSDMAVEAILLTAVDTTCGVTLAQTQTVTFTADEANQSTVTISPINTPASGPAATLSVTLKDPSGKPIVGKLVSVPAVGNATVTPLSYPGFGPGQTNSNGLAQFSVADATVETVILAAYDGTTELDQVATVNFTASESNQSTISALPSGVPAGGGPASLCGAACTSTVTVTLLSAGRLPIPGHVVSLSPSSSTVSVSPATATTNGSGVASFTVSDSAVENNVVLSALDRTSGAAMVRTVAVNFTSNEANQSTATATPAVAVVKKSSTITVTLLTGSGAPVPNHIVSLSTGSSTTKTSVLTAGGKTNSAGQIQFSLTDTAAQAVSVAATDTTANPNVTLYKPVTVTFVKP